MERSTTSSHGARLWLTKAQIEDKYKSQSIADAITKAKLEDPEARQTSTKEHPDCPNNEARLGLETLFSRLGVDFLPGKAAQCFNDHENKTRNTPTHCNLLSGFSIH